MIRRLMRTGLRRGLVEGRRGWLGVGLVATALRMLQRARHPDPKVLFCDELKPGEALVIRYGEPADRMG